MTYCVSCVRTLRFNSDEVNKLAFSVTVKSPLNVVKSISYSESEESGVAMLLTASTSLHIQKQPSRGVL